MGEGGQKERTSRIEAMIRGSRNESTDFLFPKRLIKELIANILCLCRTLSFCLLSGIWEMSLHFLTTQFLTPWVKFILIQFVFLLELKETGKINSMAAVCQC